MRRSSCRSPFQPSSGWPDAVGFYFGSESAGLTDDGGG